MFQRQVHCHGTLWHTAPSHDKLFHVTNHIPHAKVCCSYCLSTVAKLFAKARNRMLWRYLRIFRRLLSTLRHVSVGCFLINS
jgi:hypothetical protein